MGDASASNGRVDASESEVPAGNAEAAIRRLPSAGINRARSTTSDSVTAESLEKKTLVIVGISIGLLLLFFVICALHEGFRLLLCATQLLVIGMLSIAWEEESFVPSASLSKARRLWHFLCQFMMIVVPLASGIWLFILGVNVFIPEDDLGE